MLDARDLVLVEISNGIFEFQNNPDRNGKIGFIADNVLGALGLIYSETKPAQPGYYWWDGDGWCDAQVILVEYCFDVLFAKGRCRDESGFYLAVYGLDGRFANCPRPPETKEMP